MANPLVIELPHDLGRAEARRRLEHGLTDLASGMGEVTQSWNGDTLNFTAAAMGQAITGALEVLQDKIRLSINLPGMLGMMSGPIKRAIQERGQLLLK